MILDQSNTNNNGDNEHFVRHDIDVCAVVIRLAYFNVDCLLRRCYHKYSASTIRISPLLPQQLLSTINLNWKYRLSLQTPEEEKKQHKDYYYLQDSTMSLSQPKAVSLDHHLSRALLVLTPSNDLEPRPSRISTMNTSQRRNLLRGRVVEIVARLPNGTEVIVNGLGYLSVLRASSPTLDEQLSSMSAQEISRVGKIVFRVNRTEPLLEILKFLDQLSTQNGVMGEMNRVEHNSMFCYFQILEVARIMEFDIVIDQMKARLNNMFYKGKHFKLPIDQVKLIYKAASTSSTSDRIKTRIVNSAARAYVDRELTNTRDVNLLMEEITEFGRAADKATNDYRKEKAAKEKEQADEEKKKTVATS